MWQDIESFMLRPNSFQDSFLQLNGKTSNLVTCFNITTLFVIRKNKKRELTLELPLLFKYTQNKQNGLNIFTAVQFRYNLPLKACIDCSWSE